MKVSWVYTDSQSSEEDEENLEFSISIFDIFDEVRIHKKKVIDCLDHSILVLLGSEDSYDIVRKKVYDYPKFIGIDLQNL